MSAWRVVVKTLSAGPMHVREINQALKLDEIAASWNLQRAAKAGMVERCPGRYGYWQLTQRGQDCAENRVRAVVARPGGTKWVPTWLYSLPRDVRINQQEQA